MSLFLKNLPVTFYRTVVSSRPIFNKATSLFASIARNSSKTPFKTIHNNHARAICFGDSIEEKICFKNFHLNFDRSYSKKSKKKSGGGSGGVTCAVGKEGIQCKIDCDQIQGKKSQDQDLKKSEADPCQIPCGSKSKPKKDSPPDPCPPQPKPQKSPRKQKKKEICGEPHPKKPSPKKKKKETPGVCKGMPDRKNLTGTWVSKKCINFDFKCQKGVDKEGTDPVKLEDLPYKPLPGGTGDLWIDEGSDPVKPEKLPYKPLPGSGELWIDGEPPSASKETRCEDPPSASKETRAKDPPQDQSLLKQCVAKCKKSTGKKNMSTKTGKPEDSIPPECEEEKRPRKKKPKKKSCKEKSDKPKKAKKEEKPCKPCSSKETKKGGKKEESIVKKEENMASKNAAKIEKLSKELDECKRSVSKLAARQSATDGGECQPPPKLNQKLPKPRKQEKGVVGGSKNFIKSVCDGILPTKSKSTPTMTAKKESVKKSKSENCKIDLNPKDCKPCKSGPKKKVEPVKSDQCVPEKKQEKLEKLVRAASTKPKKTSPPCEYEDIKVEKTEKKESQSRCERKESQYKVYCSEDCKKAGSRKDIGESPKSTTHPKKLQVLECLEKKRSIASTPSKKGSKTRTDCDSKKLEKKKSERKMVCSDDLNKNIKKSKSQCTQTSQKKKSESKDSSEIKNELRIKSACEVEKTEKKKSARKIICSDDPDRMPRAKPRQKLCIEEPPKKKPRKEKPPPKNTAPSEKKPPESKVDPHSNEPRCKRIPGADKILKKPHRGPGLPLVPIIWGGAARRKEKLDPPSDQSPIMQCIALCKKRQRADRPQEGKGVPPRDKKPCTNDRKVYEKLVEYREEKEEIKEFVPCEHEEIKAAIRNEECEKESAERQDRVCKKKKRKSKMPKCSTGKKKKSKRKKKKSKRREAESRDCVKIPDDCKQHRKENKVVCGCKEEEEKVDKKKKDDVTRDCD